MTAVLAAYMGAIIVGMSVWTVRQGGVGAWITGSPALAKDAVIVKSF